MLSNLLISRMRTPFWLTSKVPTESSATIYTVAALPRTVTNIIANVTVYGVPFLLVCEICSNPRPHL